MKVTPRAAVSAAQPSMTASSHRRLRRLRRRHILSMFISDVVNIAESFPTASL